MRYAIAHLNYIAVLVTGLAGFIVGWLWYGVLFGKIWMAEQNITPEKMEECRKKGMAWFMIQGFVLTMLGTFGLAVVLASHGTPNWKHGAAAGAFIGVFISGMRMVNNETWEDRSARFRLLNLAHEAVLFGVQGAILGAWH